MSSENTQNSAEIAPGMTVRDPDAALRDRLADAVADEAAFEGWTRTALAAASRNLGLPAGEADRLFPGGAIQVLSHASERADFRTVEDMEKEGVAALKVRDRIKTAVGSAWNAMPATGRRRGGHWRCCRCPSTPGWG